MQAICKLTLPRPHVFQRIQLQAFAARARLSHSSISSNQYQYETSRLNMAQLDVKIPSTKLPDGSEIPLLAFGTGTAWSKKNANDSTDKKLIEGIKTAIKLGYTHLDGAEMYNTEPELGAAIKQSDVPRDHLYVVTKVSHNIADIPAAIDASLKKLGIPFVDLYLIHEPFFANGDEAKLQQAWAAMESILAAGKTKSIGVSNFLKKDLEAILKTAKVRPAINQIEYHPYLQHDHDLVTYHRNKDIRLAAFGPQLPATKATGGPLDPKLAELAKKYAVNPGEILLRWVIDQGIVVVTTSSKEQRMSDYLRVCTFKLTPREMEEISEIGSTHHVRGFWNNKFDEADRS